MQKFTKFFSLLLLVAISFFQISCGKEIPGPAGATGAQGPQGVQGPAGNPGKDGNANVQGRVLTFQSSDWIKKTTTGSSYNFSASAVVPEITQAVVDRGLVVSYRSNGSGGWVAIPSSYSFESGSKVYVINYDAVHYVGGITFWKSDSDGVTLSPGTQSFKVVVITPQGRISNPNLDYNSYQEVAKVFNLE